MQLKDARTYASHLYQNDLEGYIQLLQMENGQLLKVYSTELVGVVDVVECAEGRTDTFITPNSFYIPQRKADNIRHFRSLFLDLDGVRSKQETIWDTYILADKGLIPRPTMVVDSGRGIHLYWRIKHAPVQALATWQELEDYLYKQLRHLGADRRATDAARVLRLPGTVNSRNNRPCRVLHIEDTLYSMYDLREQYLGYKPTEKSAKPPARKVKNLYNSYSLHMARAYDIEILCRLRNYDVKGYRNKILHCYCYWRGIYIRIPEFLAEVVYELNNKFLEPQPKAEVDAMIRSVGRAVEKFIDYEQGLRSGQDKRISKKMREHGGYWYKNETLIDMLDITPDEQRHLKTIIGTDEKYRRNNERRTPRNEAGLTPRQQQKADMVNRIMELRKQGLTIKEIAQEVGLTMDGVNYHLYR